MALVNEHFLKLPNNYLFSDIAKKVNAFKVSHPKTDLIRLGIGGENAVPAGEADILIDAVRSGAADVHAGVFQGQLPIADDKITVFLDHRQEFGPQGGVIGVIAVPKDRPVFAKHQLGAAGGFHFSYESKE